MILLESVFAHLGLVFVGEKVHHFGAMIPLELDHLAHVLVLNDGAIASCVKVSETDRVNKERSLSGEDEPYSFLKAFRRALGLYSFDNPWTVVKVLRPLRSVDIISDTRATRHKEQDTDAEYGYGRNSWAAYHQRRRRKDLHKGTIISIITIEEAID